MDKKQKAAAAAMAAVTAAGMVTGAVIDNPTDLMADTPFAVEQDDDAEVSAAEQKKNGLTARVRAWLLGLPAAVRMLVGVPLWCIGWVVTTGLSTFWAGAMTPLAARLLGWLCLAVIILAVFAVSVKAAFPKVPLKRSLRPGNVIILLGVTAVLAMADLALPTVWKDFNVISQTVWRVGATCLLLFCCSCEWKRHSKYAAAQPAIAAPKRTAVEMEALRLADSVCPPRE